MLSLEKNKYCKLIFNNNELKLIKNIFLMNKNSKILDFLKKQIPTYLGNKRKLLPELERCIHDIKQILDQDTIVAGDGFSGTGIVSRLLKIHSTTLLTNDIAGYSKTLNQCFLSTPTEKELTKLKTFIKKANKYAHMMPSKADNHIQWIQKYWAPKDDANIKATERVYFTSENGRLIDRYRHFIEGLPKNYQPYLLALLLVEASIHNNTNGQFSAFYKKDGKGEYGGKTGTDIKRITQKIILPQQPVLSVHKCKVFISQQDTNNWVKTLPPVDIMYYDPPYNKHPYSIYYFLLDIINNWNVEEKIPDTYRGQPKTWSKSAYNSFVRAKNAFEHLICNTRAKFILVSYNNGGIIPLDELETILKRYGTVTKRPVIHKTYNKLKGIANYKRKKKKEKITEFIWIVDRRAFLNL